MYIYMLLVPCRAQPPRRHITHHATITTSSTSSLRSRWYPFPVVRVTGTKATIGDFLCVFPVGHGRKLKLPSLPFSSFSHSKIPRLIPIGNQLENRKEKKEGGLTMLWWLFSSRRPPSVVLFFFPSLFFFPFLSLFPARTPSLTFSSFFFFYSLFPEN